MRRALIIACRRRMVPTGILVVRAVAAIVIRGRNRIDLRAVITAAARVIRNAGRQGQANCNDREQTTRHGGLLDRERAPPATLGGDKQQHCLTSLKTAKTRFGALCQEANYALHNACPKLTERLSPNGYPDMTTPDICPACGARNDCSMANPDTEDQPCWCYGVSIDPEIIQALPLSQRDLTCLCPRCAQVQNQLPTAQPRRLT